MVIYPRDIAERIIFIADLFERAMAIDRKLPDKEKRMLGARSGWPDYVYDTDDRKDQEPENMRVRLTAAQIDTLDEAQRLLNILGMMIDNRTIVGKKIIRAKACKVSYRDIGIAAHMSPKTVENWHKKDLRRIAVKVIL